jgi:hypothetical protein
MKLNLTNVLSGFNLAAINDNFTKIAQELQTKVMYRNNPVGEPNAVETDIDMNGKRIINLDELQVGGTNVSALNSALVWRGTWSGATAYVRSDAVYHNGSSYICVTPNTNSAPPSVNWNLFAAQGATGAGSGDVLGPASAALDHLATYASGTGKVLKASGVPVSTLLTTTQLGVSVQAYDVDTAKIDVAQTYTAPQRGTVTTDNDLSLNLSATNNFVCTPTAGGTLTFTGLVNGQSGWIKLINTANYSIVAAATTKISGAALSRIGGTGTYILSYFCDGTNVYVVSSENLT